MCLVSVLGDSGSCYPDYRERSWGKPLSNNRGAENRGRPFHNRRACYSRLDKTKPGLYCARNTKHECSIASAMNQAKKSWYWLQQDSILLHVRRGARVMTLGAARSPQTTCRLGSGLRHRRSAILKVFTRSMQRTLAPAPASRHSELVRVTILQPLRELDSPTAFSSPAFNDLVTHFLHSYFNSTFCFWTSKSLPDTIVTTFASLRAQSSSPWRPRRRH